MSDPYVCEPTDPSSGRPATFIFLHGYGDDAQGLPLGLAQQFQFNNKLPHLKWLLPNAPHSRDAQGQAWYTVKALPNPMKPKVPGQDEEEAQSEDDEEGIMRSVRTVDELVQKELDAGVEGRRIVVGGFSQGCAIESLRLPTPTPDEQKKWLYVHGSKDMLVPTRLFTQGQEELKKYVGEGEMEVHLYEGMGHSTSAAELRDLLVWLVGVVPP